VETEITNLAHRMNMAVLACRWQTTRGM